MLRNVPSRRGPPLPLDNSLLAVFLHLMFSGLLSPVRFCEPEVRTPLAL